MNNSTILFLSILTLFVLSLIACEQPTESTSTKEVAMQMSNPPAPGFNETASDAKAIAIADRVMDANGGRENWDNTRHLAWTFFGRRSLIWDKQTGDVRIDFLKDSLQILMNINTDEGKVMKNGQEFTEPDSLSKYLKTGKSVWINDSYWLVFPFKLKDTGVTLKYMGKGTTQMQKEADMIQLTFQEVGDTPDNRYIAYVGDMGMVDQWDFYSTATDTVPRFSTPWLDYQKAGNIMLSSDRGMGKLTDIKVFDELPESVYRSFETVRL